MINTEKLTILFLLATIRISTCYKNEGIAISFNRSKIHIRIDVESKDGDSGKGMHADLSKGKNVKQLDNKDDENDVASISSKTKKEEEKDPEWKEGTKHKTELNQNRNTFIRERKKGKTLKKGTSSTKSKKKQRREKTKNSREQQGKNRTNNKDKGKTRYNKETNEAKDKEHMNKTRKGKTFTKEKKIEQNVRMRKKAKEDEANSFRLTERKKGKLVKNPEGSPNPNDLKIPLTFERESITNDWNNSMEIANEINIIEKEGKNKSNEERKLNEKGSSKEETGKENSPRETANQWNIDSKIRNFTKQIVTATLKEITNIKNTTNKIDNNNNNNNNDVNQKPSNPLIERMVSNIMLVAIGN